MRSVCVVIPTYNERDNLPRLVAGIAALKISGLRMLVVDDSSPDGTGRVADGLARIYPLRVLHRARKKGLGTAYVHGFRSALADQPDFIVKMDADLSHDPAAIPNFLNTAESHDVVLGSRYVSGGGIQNWRWLRRTISRAGNLYARILLGLPYRDVTGDYKCFRREALECLNLENISSIGYNFQIETTYRLHRLGLRITKISITFTERTTGRSKFQIGIILESFLKVLFLRFRQY